MPIPCRCGACNTKFRVKESVAGKKVRCPKCGEAFRVPIPGAVPKEKAKPVALPPTPPLVSQPEAEKTVAEGIESSVPVEPVAAPVQQAPIVNVTPQSQQPTQGNAVLPQAAPIAQPLSGTDLPVAKPLGSAVPQAAPIQPGVPTAAPLDTGSAGGIKISTEPRVRRRKKMRLSTVLVTMVFLASCLILIAALFIFLQSRGPKTAVLRVNIPTNLREDCAVSIDGSTKDVSLTQVPLQFDISRGKHRVSLRRIGHQKVDYDLDVKGAEVVELSPDWIPMSEESPDNETMDDGLMEEEEEDDDSAAEEDNDMDEAI